MDDKLKKDLVCVKDECVVSPKKIDENKNVFEYDVTLEENSDRLYTGASDVNKDSDKVKQRDTVEGINIVSKKDTIKEAVFKEKVSDDSHITQPALPNARNANVLSTLARYMTMYSTFDNFSIRDFDGGSTTLGRHNYPSKKIGYNAKKVAKARAKKKAAKKNRGNKRK